MNHPSICNPRDANKRLHGSGSFVIRDDVPGTRWCGRGNIAYNDTEYGVYRGLDKCCMAHDLCDDYIRPKSERYGLYNKYICRRYIYIYSPPPARDIRTPRGNRHVRDCQARA